MKDDAIEVHTLYVMNTSMRKKDRKTLMPYNAALKARDKGGTGILLFQM